MLKKIRNWIYLTFQFKAELYFTENNRGLHYGIIKNDGEFGSFKKKDTRTS